MSLASRAAGAPVADDATPANDAAEARPFPGAVSAGLVAAPAPVRRARRVAATSIVVLVVGVLVSGLASFGAYSVRENNEDRLLEQRVREVATLLTASIPNVSTPLSGAALVAESTRGNEAAFTNAVRNEVGAGQRFVSVSLWTPGARAPAVVVGAPPELAAEPPARVADLLQRGLASRKLLVENLLDAPERRLGYALSAPLTSRRYVVYAETALPRDRRSRLDKNSAFADLDYALFVGGRPQPDLLLASSTGGAQLRGHTSSQVVPFGDTSLLITMRATRELGGALLARLWWLLATVGTLLSVAAFALVERLNRNQRHAEDLADQNARLFTEQRTVAQTLQQSLLADLPPPTARLETAARYIAGVEGIDIGGDWYDVVAVGDDHVLVVVGDVSGRGLPAATMMAELRFAIRAYAVQGVAPAAILADLGRLLSVGRDGHFATALCACIDLRDGTLVVANAGHPPPLLIDGDDRRFLVVPVGPPVGVVADVRYDELATTLPHGATLLLYTDGLVERRGEILDTGLERLRAAARRRCTTVDELLDAVVGDVIPDGAGDDAAILGVRWHA